MGFFENITWTTQARRILAPVMRRGTSFVLFVQSLIKPLETVNAAWVTFEADVRKRSKFNGQKIVLQEALNDIFGVTVAPFIQVETNQVVGAANYFYKEAESDPDPNYFYKEAEPGGINYFYKESEGGGQTNFTVKIPVGIHTAELEARVSAETNKYKLAGMTFDIVTY